MGKETEGGESTEREMVECQRQIWTILELAHNKLYIQERERKRLFLLFSIPSN